METVVAETGFPHVGGGWREVHAELLRIATRRGALDAHEARWLVAASRAAVYREVGCGSMAEYLERVLGYSPRVAGGECQGSCRFSRDQPPGAATPCSGLRRTVAMGVQLRVCRLQRSGRRARAAT